MSSSSSRSKTSSQKVCLITGSSSGIGRATASYFASRGWIVVATMRRPENDQHLSKLPGVDLLPLDVTDEKSIEAAFAQTLAKFGRIDAVVNNAGYGLTGPFEESSPEQIRRQFNTNVFGLMAVSRAAIGAFRPQGHGRLINISSVGGRVTFPLYSLYHSTKWAVEGFTESLNYEVEQFGIKGILIEPGAIKTDFYERSADRPISTPNSPYRAFVDRLTGSYDDAAARAVDPIVVAETIFRAATSARPRLRYATGGGAPALLTLRRLLPDRAFNGLIKRVLKA